MTRERNPRYRNGCCSRRNPCPVHREIALRYRNRHGFDFDSERDEDLNRLARHRYGDTLPDSDEGRRFALVMAHHLGEPDSIRAYLDRAAPWYDEDDADKLIKAVIKKRYRWSADQLASTKWLAVSYAERQMLGLRTIGAYDMSKRERTAMRRERYRERHRQNDRAYREQQRRANAKPTRAAWLQANSASRTKPWLAAGFNCRRTWERHGKPGPGTDVAGCSITYTSSEKTSSNNLRHGNEQAGTPGSRPGQGASDRFPAAARPKCPRKPKHWLPQPTTATGRVVVSDRLATPAERLSFMSSQTFHERGVT
jgi:hypothetical protein